MNLPARSQRREQILRMAKSGFVDRAAKLFLSLYRADLELLKPGDQVAHHVPIGKDKFVAWCKDAIERFFHEMSGILDNEKMLKEFAVQVGETIGKSNTDVQNPMRDYEKATDPIFVRANKQVYVKKAQYKPTTSAKPAVESIYAPTTEHFRYDPANPGVQLFRVEDKKYMSPVSESHDQKTPWKGEWNYKGAREVNFETGVQNQTHPGWNNMHPVLPFLSTKSKDSEVMNPKGKDYSYDREGLYGVKSPETPEEKKADLLTKIVKKANYNESLFAPTTMPTRYCPDHPAQQTTRLADGVRQCPLDGKIYDFVHGFKTEDGKFHSGGSVQDQNSIPPGSVIIRREASTKNKKQAQVSDSVHGFLYTHVLPHLGPNAEYARRVLNYQFSKPGVGLEQAIMDIKKADELAAAQQQATTASSPLDKIAQTTRIRIND